MYISPQDIEEKTYNMCLSCHHIGKNCDGPNFLAMSMERWCEWCRLRKEYLNWTNAHIAEAASISKVSVDRVISGNVKDLRNTTMQAITKALVNGSWGQYPCAMAAVSADNPELLGKCEQLQAELDRIKIEHETELNRIIASEQKKVVFLREQIAFKESQLISKDHLLEERYNYIKQKDRIIRGLSIVTVIFVLLIIVVLLIDRFNPNAGFFWLGH